MYMFEIYSAAIVFSGGLRHGLRYLLPAVSRIVHISFSHRVWELWRRRRRIDPSPQDGIFGGTAVCTHIYMNVRI